MKAAEKDRRIAAAEKRLKAVAGQLNALADRHAKLREAQDADQAQLEWLRAAPVDAAPAEPQPDGEVSS